MSEAVSEVVESKGEVSALESGKEEKIVAKKGTEKATKMQLPVKRELSSSISSSSLSNDDKETKA